MINSSETAAATLLQYANVQIEEYITGSEDRLERTALAAIFKMIQHLIHHQALV